MKKPRPENRSELKKVLMASLLGGGAVIRKGFGKALSIQKKGPVSIVTQIDKAAERKILSTILRRFPGHRILTEESRPVLGGSDYRWIIDPLDGTTNFAHKLPLCCVSIAVEERGEIILGGIHNPMTGELYFAEKGKGAFLNGKRIRVSGISKMIDSLLVTGFPYDGPERAKFYLKFFKVMMERSQGIRRLGAAALDLAYVASGKFEAFWELNLQPWDVAAGILIVTEAGGKVSNYRGEPMKVDRPRHLLASNGRVHAPILSLFRKML